MLEKTINSSIADNNYGVKKEGYRQSNILLTRSISEKPKVGKNTQFNHAIKSLNIDNFEHWNSEAIDKRQEILANLATKVWGMSEVLDAIQEDDIAF